MNCKMQNKILVSTSWKRDVQTDVLNELLKNKRKMNARANTEFVKNYPDMSSRIYHRLTDETLGVETDKKVLTIKSTTMKTLFYRHKTNPGNCIAIVDGNMLIGPKQHRPNAECGMLDHFDVIHKGEWVTEEEAKQIHPKLIELIK